MTTKRDILALIAGFLVAPSALTCSSSSDSQPVQTQVLRPHKSSSVVVLAKVIEAKFQDALFTPFGESPTHRAKLEVIESWKGRHQPGSFVEAITPTFNGTCAVVLTPGETYLLYLRAKAPYDVSLSPRSARIVDASQDLEILKSRFRKM
jgi:hypothetical protein